MLLNEMLKAQVSTSISVSSHSEGAGRKPKGGDLAVEGSVIPLSSIRAMAVARASYSLNS